MEPEFRKLDSSRITQDLTQAQTFAPGGRVPPQQPLQQSLQQPLQATLREQVASKGCVSTPQFSDHQTVSTPHAVRTPGGVSTPRAQVAQVSQAASREVKMELVSPRSPQRTPTAVPSVSPLSPTNVLEEVVSSLQLQVQNLGKLLEEALSKMEQQPVIGQPDVALGQPELLRMMQAQVKKLQEQQNVFEAKQESRANGDRVSIDIELKDLRWHADAQAKLAQTRQTNWEADMQQVLEQRGMGSTAAADSEIIHLRDNVKAQAEQVAVLGSHVRSLQEQLREDEKLLESSAAQVAAMARESVATSDVQDMQDQLSQQAQFIRQVQADLPALQSETRSVIKSLREGLVKELSNLRAEMSTTSTQLSNPRVELETKEMRKTFEMRLAQQEQIIQEVRTHVGSIDERTLEIMPSMLQPRGQADSQVVQEVDVLKQEMAAQRSVQSSELQREADALHSHVHKVVSAEREARIDELQRYQTMVNGLKHEVAELGDDFRRLSLRSSSSSLVKPVTTEVSNKYECVNPKLMNSTPSIDTLH